MMIVLLVLLFAQSAYALDVAAPEIEAPACWGSPVPPYPGDAGTGVIIGVVGSGIDLDHADFLDENGDTRILFCWDQVNGSSPPPGYGYGTEWDEAEINAGTATEKDLTGIGTHVAGCAAANGRAGHPLHRYVGVAPGASLIVVKSAFLFESRIEDAVEYVFGKADLLGMPAVVCVLYGTHKGAHDGSYPLDENLSALTRAGRLIVVPVGDEAELAQHASTSVEGLTTFSVPPYSPQAALSEAIEIEGWHDPPSSWNVRLTGPNGGTTGWVAPGAFVNLPVTPDGGLYLENDVNSSSSGAKKIRVRAYETTPTPPAIGTWTIETDAIVNGRVDWWITEYLLAIMGSDIPMFLTNVDATMTLKTPATADSTLAVGAYTTKTTWTNGIGGTSLYLGAPPLGEVADFSGTGPCRDGANRPDVAAPGYGVMASLSTDIPNGTAPAWMDIDQVHRMHKGTNMAAGVVTGAVALLLEAQPTLTPSGARAILHSDALADAFTGMVPNNEWGYGKVRVDCGAGTGVPTGPVVRLRIAPNPGRQPSIFTDNNGPVIGYSVEGRELFRLTPAGGTVRVPESLSPGVYVVNQGQSSAKLTIVR